MFHDKKGSGNLACISYAGGRPISKRRRFYPGYEDTVRDEVNFLSYYARLRDVAAGRSYRKRNAHFNRSHKIIGMLSFIAYVLCVFVHTYKV